MKKNNVLLSFIIVISFFFITSCKKTSNEIIVGGLFDITGQTAETGTKFAEGIRSYIDYINLKGGINGRKVRLIEYDTAYMATRDLAAYDKLINEDNAHLIIGWSTGGTTALLPKIKKDKIPFTGVSLSKNLADVKAAPYNYLMSPTYSDQVKIIFKYILSDWKDKSRKPKVALLYNDTEFGKSPVPDARMFAEKMGIEIVSEEIVFLDAREAGDQITRMKEKNPDYAIVNETAWSASVILKEAKKNNLKTRFIGLIWCTDDKVVAFAGKDAEGYMGVFPFLFDPSIPGIKEILEYNIKKNPAGFNPPIRYINGWVLAMVMLEGVRRAGDDLSHEGIIRGIESINNFNTGDITAPFSFSKIEHIGYKKIKLGRVINGKWQIITDFLSAED